MSLYEVKPYYLLEAYINYFESVCVCVCMCVCVCVCACVWGGNREWRCQGVGVTSDLKFTILWNYKF